MTITKEAVIQLLGDRPVAYHPILARVLGGVIEAVFLSQLLYWHGKGKLADNWIFKTMVEWEEETGLTRRNQQTARKNLLKLGIIEYQVRGVPGKGHYRLDVDKLVELFSLHGSDNVQTVQTRKVEPCKLDCTDQPTLIDRTVQSIPETTRDYPEIIPERGAAEKTPPAPSLREQAEAGQMTTETELDLLLGFGRQGQAGVADPSQDIEQYMRYTNDFLGMYRKRTGLHADSHVQKPAIQEIATRPGADLELWGNVITAWVKHGWNKRNVAGMIECYERGEIPSTGNGARNATNKRNNSGTGISGNRKRPEYSVADPSKFEPARAPDDP